MFVNGGTAVAQARIGLIWLDWFQSVGWWWCDFRMKRNWSPDAQIQIFALGIAGPIALKWRKSHRSTWR